MNPKCDEVGSYFLEIWFFLRFYRETAEKMNPILGQRPPQTAERMKICQI